MTVRIGSVPYLNSKVLIHGLEPEGAAPDGTPYTLELLAPSLLAKRLSAGGLDVALVSSVEYFRHPEYTLLPGLGVCGDREMWSIQLFCRTDVKDLRRVGLDPASETTNALLRVILSQKHKLNVEYVPLDRHEDPRQRDDLDGFLRIGDPCLRMLGRAPEFQTLDLQSEWRALTGLPFVYAAWLVRGGADLRGIPELLTRAKAAGVAHAGEIADEFAAEIGFEFERAKEYVAAIVHYEMEGPYIEGLKRFQACLVKEGIVRAERPIVFYGA
ncbi:MAG: menaquinone biosynthesis protein [Planctomycetota bacterium]|nr:menaquinone biosynthesis protein [Planctomycetota bacterium]